MSPQFGHYCSCNLFNHAQGTMTLPSIHSFTISNPLFHNYIIFYYSIIILYMSISQPCNPTIHIT